jgi:hypothetical protein
MSTVLHNTSLRLLLIVGTFAGAQLACLAAESSPPASQASALATPPTEPAISPIPGKTTAPTEAAAPTPEAPSLPNRPFSSSGPWVVIASDDRLSAMNADGSGLTTLWDIYGEGLNIDELLLYPSPAGGRVAIVQIDKRFEGSAPILKLLELPSGTLRTIADLLPKAMQGGAIDSDAVTQVWAAVGLKNRLAWSSDGRWLAFNAAIEGPSADVYVYDTSNGRIARLTDGPDQSTDLAWSPDDGTIVHSVARSLYYGYSGIGYDMLGAWAVPPDPAKSPLHLYDHAFLGFEHILGWLDDGRYLGDSLDGEELGNCGFFNLRTVDLLKGEGPQLLAGHYSLRAFDPETGTALLVLWPTLKDFDCSTSLEAGVYLFDLGSRQARLLPEIVPDAILGVTWSREAGLFFLGGGEELVGVDPLGNVSRFPSIQDLYDSSPVVRPGGELWALPSGSLDGTLAVGTRTGQLIELDVAEAHSPFWSPDGSWLFFFDALHLYAAPAPGFAPALIVGDMLSPQPAVLVNP